MSVYLLCEQAIGLIRGKRLILSSDERNMLEALNYEGLTGAHAQDEAVVCALHFPRVRDKLFELYPWKFARKAASVYDGVLPEDCVSVLLVCVDGVPVEYEQIGSKLNIEDTCEVHYTARIADVEQWSGLFREVFCYGLAEEICSAVTGEVQYMQILEAKMQELIPRGIGQGQSRAKHALR